jgi:hypothetical protein
MPLYYQRLHEKAKDEAMYVSDRRLYVTADRECLVEEGDPKARFLLVAEGGELSMEEARRYGLVKDEAAPAGKSVPKPKDKARRPAKNKAVQGPAEDKAARLEA